MVDIIRHFVHDQFRGVDFRRGRTQRDLYRDPVIGDMAGVGHLFTGYDFFEFLQRGPGDPQRAAHQADGQYRYGL